MDSEEPSPRLEAQNFLRVLGLIDRTILPRRVFLTNGRANLVLIVARSGASLDNPRSAGQSLEGLTKAITRFCASGRPVSYRLEPASRAPSGHAAIAIVNAQDLAERPGENRIVRQYSFTKNGWPLATPPRASFASLMGAAHIARAMASWDARNGNSAEPTLILAISDGLTEDMSVSLDDRLTITTTPPAQLGRIVSRWRSLFEKSETGSELG